jgi:hypothetical protein
MQLLSNAKKPNRKAAESAIFAIKNIFTQGSIELQSQKLHVFTKNPVILSKREGCTNEEILEAYFEHCIREIVRDFIS